MLRHSILCAERRDLSEILRNESQIVIRKLSIPDDGEVNAIERRQQHATPLHICILQNHSVVDIYVRRC